jgi:uncharacterized protein with gpF-like domain
MRIAGRQKGSKVKPYTHVVVQPSAPKSRYTFSYHSSEDKAKAAAKKYERLVGNPLRVVKQSGKSANTDVMEEANMQENIKESLWDNIRKRRAAGKRKLRPGDKNYPKTLDVGEDVPSTSTASIPNPADTAMGPRLKTTTMHDKRRKKDKFPVLLKRFRKYIEDNYA